MSCAICQRSSCTQSFHSLEQQERYFEVICAMDSGQFDLAQKLREKIENEEEPK